MRIIFIIVICCLLSGRALKSSSDSHIKYITVTQRISQVFGDASDRKVDRIRLRKAAERKIAVQGVSTSTNSIVGLRVERMTHISSNRVEAVFSYSLATPDESS